MPSCTGHVYLDRDRGIPNSFVMRSEGFKLSLEFEGEEDLHVEADCKKQWRQAVVFSLLLFICIKILQYPVPNIDKISSITTSMTLNSYPTDGLHYAKEHTWRVYGNDVA